MARIARCPHCRKPITSGPTPSQAKREAEAAAAAERRHKREVEQEVRRWYAADFKIIFQAVERTKMNQANPSRAVSKPLYESVLAAHRKRLDALENQIQTEVAERLKR